MIVISENGSMFGLRGQAPSCLNQPFQPDFPLLQRRERVQSFSKTSNGISVQKADNPSYQTGEKPGKSSRGGRRERVGLQILLTRSAPWLAMSQAHLLSPDITPFPQLPLPLLGKQIAKYLTVSPTGGAT